jgi:hypothetical protein
MGSSSDRANRAVVPSSIFLLYIPFAHKEISLLREFEFFVYPIALQSMSHTDLRWKHRPDIVADAVEDCMRHINEHAVDLDFIIAELRDRLPFTPFVLPPNNFQTSQAVLRENLRDLARSGEWRALCNMIKLRRYKRQDFPDLKGRPAKKPIKAFTDNRELVFVPAMETEWHAPVRELKLFSNPKAILNKLNQIYRVGVPLNDGFHYDAQFTEGKKFGANMEFQCCERGSVVAIGWPYANVYPNDFIRAGRE